MKALGLYLDSEEVKILMERADKDGSGTIEEDEFLSLMAEKINARNPEEQLMKAFHVYHDDDDKTL
eukprot:CAMPEP_0116880894 /NCGR_PEP_ID=MMETSP0463-20121206/12920_1 /TAXON_ID=181622 /ORGANISM="Strombidinopsis sp, Strain SopsisLIS2011" /LENGTH=65 /DNA_ID=CAMNT_0004532123 /DNA_START=371 /DNA_END=568 /DNA_ORIENTATION=-